MEIWLAKKDNTLRESQLLFIPHLELTLSQEEKAILCHSRLQIDQKIWEP
jgi:hypothetical protein